MNTRDTVAAQAATIERLKDRIADLEAEVQHAYVALTRAHYCYMGTTASDAR